MASGSFNITTSNPYIVGRIDWSSVENNALNYSSVTVKMYLWRTNGYTTTGSGDFNVSIHDQFRTQHRDFTIGSSAVLVFDDWVDVYHNADGKKQITISWAGFTNVFDVTQSNGSATLDTIPRASTLAAGHNFTVGGSVTFSINRASTDFTHDIKIELYNGSSWVTVETLTGIGASYTWSPTSADLTTMFDAINNDTTYYDQLTRITLTTKQGGTTVGSNQYEGKASSPAASTTSSSASFTVGNAVTVAITRAYSSFIHTIRFYVNNVLIHTSPYGQGTSYTWTPTVAEKNTMYDAMPNSKTYTSKIEIDTFYNSSTTDQKIKATTSKTGTATLTNANPTFTTASYYDDNSTITALTEDSSYIVQSKSTLKAKILSANKATAFRGATITKYIATVAGESVTIQSPFAVDIIFDFGTINATTNQSLIITVYDSRGFTKSVTLTVKVAAWSPPTINGSASRASGFLDDTTLKVNGRISPVAINGVNKNSLVPASTTFAYRTKGGVYNAATALVGQTLTMPDYNTSDLVIPLSSTSDWEIKVIVTDKFGSNTMTISVGQGIPIMMIDDLKKGVGIGQFAETGYALAVTGISKFKGTIDMQNNNIENVNNLTFNDIGINEGIEWKSATHAWKIFVSGDTDPSLGGALRFYLNGAIKASINENGTFIAGADGVFTSSSGYVVLRPAEGAGITYIQSDTEIRATMRADGSTYVPVRASSFPTGSSILFKSNLEKIEDTGIDALSLLMNEQVWRYHLNNNLQAGVYDKPKIGLIAEMVNPLLRDEDGVDPYSIVSLVLKALQQQNQIVTDLKSRVETLEYIA